MSLGAALIGLVVTLGVLAILVDVLESANARRRVNDLVDLPPPPLPSRRDEEPEL